MSMDNCKNCNGHGEVSANGSIRQCPVCDGYGYIGHIFTEFNHPLSLKQSLVVWAFSCAVILVVLIVGQGPWLK